MPDFNPTSITINDLNRWVHKAPFEPFVVRMSNGDAYEVPTPDHLIITKILRRVTLEMDDGRSVDINPLHVVSIAAAKNAA